MILTKGTKAPDFTLNSTPDQQLSLEDFKGEKSNTGFLPCRLESCLWRPDGTI